MHRDGSTTRAMGSVGVGCRASSKPGTAVSQMPSGGVCRSIAATSLASSSVATSALPADRPRSPQSVYPRRVFTFTGIPTGFGRLGKNSGRSGYRPLGDSAYHSLRRAGRRSGEPLVRPVRERGPSMNRYAWCLALVLPGCDRRSPSDWPQWQGPDRNAVSKETGLLQEWPKDGRRSPGRRRGSAAATAPRPSPAASSSA